MKLTYFVGAGVDLCIQLFVDAFDVMKIINKAFNRA